MTAESRRFGFVMGSSGGRHGHRGIDGDGKELSIHAIFSIWGPMTAAVEIFYEWKIKSQKNIAITGEIRKESSAAWEDEGGGI
jgi:hypothetical protein